MLGKLHTRESLIHTSFDLGTTEKRKMTPPRRHIRRRGRENVALPRSESFRKGQ
jgi:hypothetical protein